MKLATDNLSLQFSFCRQSVWLSEPTNGGDGPTEHQHARTATRATDAAKYAKSAKVAIRQPASSRLNESQHAQLPSGVAAAVTEEFSAAAFRTPITYVN